MTSRDTLSSGSLSTALAQKPNGQGEHSTALDGDDLRWQEIVSWFPTPQQKELVVLARQEGLLNSLPLPKKLPCKPPSVDTEPEMVYLFSQLLNGSVTQLPNFPPESLSVSDTGLDPYQKEAVAKAFSTPDLCLIQGPPGSGKSRVAGEIIFQAAKAGQRVLLLAPTSEGIDHILSLVNGRDNIYAFRCLSKDESIEELPPTSRAFTFAERSRILRERSLDCARQAIAENQRRLQLHPEEESIWKQLPELSRRHHELKELEAKQLENLARIAEDVEKEICRVLDAYDEGNPEFPNSDLPSACLNKLMEKYQESRHKSEPLIKQITELTREREERQKELDSLSSQITLLQPFAEARKNSHWWSPIWWQAFFKGVQAEDLTKLENQQQTLQGAIEKLEWQIDSFSQDKDLADKEFAEQRLRISGEHVVDKQNHLQQQIEKHRAELTKVETDWSKLIQGLDEEIRPKNWALEEISNGRNLWENRCAQEKEKARFFQQWLEYLKESGEILSNRIPHLTNLVAGTVDKISEDPHFGTSSAQEPFDLLLLEEAHLISDQDVLRLSRLARRFILIGEPRWDLSGNLNKPQKSDPKTPLRQKESCFQRLWTLLHCDPSSAYYWWFYENNSLHCRMIHLSSEDRETLECETVADRPEIELRIFDQPRLGPVLAEVVFPEETPLAEAKEYIFNELQEAAVLTSARNLRWCQDENKVILSLVERPLGDLETVPLGDGILEIVAGSSRQETNAETTVANTVRFEFLRDKNWDLEKARQWIEIHLGWRSLERTVFLELAHRMDAPLGAVLGELLPGDLPVHFLNGKPEANCRDNRDIFHKGTFVEFVPVPSPEKQKKSKNRSRNEETDEEGIPSKGAGLELDLGTPKSTDRLPQDLRSDLPNHGYVNYQESQAIVHKLQELLKDTAVQKILGSPEPCFGPKIAVLALYPSQAVLIRKLIDKTPALSGTGICIEVATPAEFRHKECLIGLISLTRSHGHRAVTYGDNVDWLPLALTRPRRRLIIFGDPGTLNRRSEWKRGVDHLDEFAANREAQLVKKLLSYLQGNAKNGWAFRLSQS